MLPCIYYFELVFPTEQDSATAWDKGTKVPSLSRDKGTTGQAQNLAMEREGTDCQNPGRDAGRDAGRDNHYFSVKIRDRTGTRQSVSIFYHFLS